MRDESSRLSDLRPALELRACVMRAIRSFFEARDYLEIDTPIHVATPAMELHIDAEPAGEGAYLRTSPELHLKRLLAAGYERIFQIGPCFRQGERGALHHPEYTMLEWYRCGCDYQGILDETLLLLQAVAESLPPQAPARQMLCAPPALFKVGNLFMEQAGWDPASAFDAVRFDLDLVEKIEPSLPRDRPVILMDYPAACCALARLKPGAPQVAERWELYLGGVEVANAYSELTDPVEQRLRFEHWGAERKQAGRAVYPLDEAFLGALEAGMPDCGGIALGIDRLLLICLGRNDLDALLPFREG